MRASEKMVPTDEIREVLRLPRVPSIFEELATEHALAACWRALVPSLELRSFEEAADDLRARAAHTAVELGCPLIETQLEWAGYDLDEIDEIRQVVGVFHYQNAKLLLFTSALLRCLDGGCGGRRGNGRALMKLPRGVPDGMPELEQVPENADGKLGRCFAEMREHGGAGRVPDEFRALGRWPRYLELAWADARGRDHDQRARVALDGLLEQADAAAVQLPHRSRLSEADLRAAGADPTRVLELLQRTRASLAGRVLDLALFKVQLDGAEDAVDSPYPVEWEYLSADDYLPDDLDEELKLRAGDPTSLDDVKLIARSR